MKNENKQLHSDIFAELKEKYESLSKSHKKMAHFMLNNYEKVADMSAVQVAEAVGISEATVVRFANSLGFDGYIEFRKILREYLHRKLTTIERLNSSMTDDAAWENIDNAFLAKKILKNDIKAIQNTMDDFDNETFDQCVDLLLSARRVYIIGFRSTGFLAEFTHYYLSVLLDDVRMINQRANCFYENLIKLDERDVVLAISFPRYSQSALEAVEFSKSKNAKVIVISDNEQAPLNQYADHLLLAKSDGISFVDSLAAPMSLINALIVAIGSNNISKTKKNFKELEAIWKRHDVYAGDELVNDLP